MKLKKFPKIHHLAECLSTQDEALRLALELKTAAAVLSDYQSQGRGRQGRQWVAAAGKNLLFSVAIPLDEVPRPLTWISLLAGHSLLSVLGQHEEALRSFQLKWPNDCGLYQKGFQKFAGILVEIKKGHVIIGWGANLQKNTLFQSALSLQEMSDYPYQNQGLAQILLNYFYQALRAWTADDLSFGDAFLEYVTRENFKEFWGQPLKAQYVAPWSGGIARGIDGEGNLIIAPLSPKSSEDSTCAEYKVISSGEIFL